MSYNSLLEEENINAQYLCVLNPARRVSSWTLQSGSIYYADLTLGYVNKLQVDGAAYTAASSASLSAGEFFYDTSNSRLYIRLNGGGNPNSTGFIVAFYEIYVATFDAHFYRNPLDDSTDEVYWEPLVETTPVIKQTITSVEFGFLPTQSTSIVLNNAEHIIEKHLYDSSFKDKDLCVYHWLDELSVDNMKLVFKGKMNNLSYSKSRLSISVLDDISIFDNEYRFGATNFYTSDDYSSLDPNKEGSPIRYVYGVVDGFVPVNLDYVEEGVSTSDNRVFGVRADGANLATETKTCGGGTHTTTRTFLTSTSGLRVGDSVWFDRVSGTDEYHNISAVTSTYIDHPTLAGAMADGDSIKRGTVGRVEIRQGELVYYPQFTRDWTESVDAQGVVVLTFSSSLESNASIPETLRPSDDVICRVYGKRNDVTLNASSFGSDDTETNNLTNASVILLDLIKNLGIEESEINISSFTTLLSLATDALSFAIPADSNSSFPSYKDVILGVLRSSFIKIYKDFDLKWKVTQTTPIVSTSKEIEDDEILSFDYGFSYNDICSDFLIHYGFNEKAFNDLGSSRSSVSVSSGVARYLHEVDKQMEVETYHLKDAEALLAANRYAYIYGNQSGELTIRTKNRFFNNIIDDDINVVTTKMPGFDYDVDTLREREFSLVEIDKSLRSVKLVLSDQKGIQDNEGDWNG